MSKRQRNRSDGDGHHQPASEASPGARDVDAHDVVGLTPEARELVSRLLDGVSRAVGRPVSRTELLESLRTLRQQTGGNDTVQDPSVMAALLEILGKGIR